MVKRTVDKPESSPWVFGLMNPSQTSLSLAKIDQVLNFDENRTEIAATMISRDTAFENKWIEPATFGLEYVQI